MNRGAERGAPLVFYERRAYRRRRLRDAARLLPVAGLFAWTIPLLWPQGPGAPATSAALIYVFAVWATLLGVGALLSRRATTGAEDGPEEPDRGQAGPADPPDGPGSAGSGDPARSGAARTQASPLAASAACGARGDLPESDAPAGRAAPPFARPR